MRVLSRPCWRVSDGDEAFATCPHRERIVGAAACAARRAAAAAIISTNAANVLVISAVACLCVRTASPAATGTVT